jgi:hypothetical protein
MRPRFVSAESALSTPGWGAMTSPGGIDGRGCCCCFALLVEAIGSGSAAPAGRNGGPPPRSAASSCSCAGSKILNVRIELFARRPRRGGGAIAAT